MSSTHKATQLQFFMGAAILGLSLGGLLYWGIRGFRPGNVLVSRDSLWFAGFLIAVCVFLAIVAGNVVLRVAWLLSAATVILSITTGIGGTGSVPWCTRELLTVVFASLLVVGGASAAPSPALRIAAIVLLVAAIPVRYWTVKQWHELLEPPSVISGAL